MIDFGLSKQYDAASGSQTSTTPVGISEGYAPMEQYTQGGVGSFTPETDVYSLGATYFKLLTGQTPPSASEVSEDGIPVGELTTRGISPQAIDVISKAMENRKKDRYKTIGEFVEALKNGDDQATPKANADNEATRLVESTESEAGRKVESNECKSHKPSLQELAEARDAKAQYDLAKSFGENEDYGNAVKWYRKAAEQGHADAQYQLGECYRYGWGVKENKGLAAKWYGRAAEQEHADAQYQLGECYLFGEGLNENEESAVKWYAIAAEKGHADAQYQLGECYRYGWGVEKNLALAQEWHEKAKEQGYQPSSNHIFKKNHKKRRIDFIIYIIVSLFSFGLILLVVWSIIEIINYMFF